MKMQDLINQIRMLVGERLFWWGFKIMPKGVRCGISTIVNIGQQWAKADPEKFDELLTAAKTDRPHKLTIIVDEARIEYGAPLGSQSQ
jgi:hypothetical protein